MRGTHRLPRPAAAAAAAVFAVLGAYAGNAWAGTAFDPASCTSLSGAPSHPAIDYGAAIQTIFTSFNGVNGCSDCHTSSGGPAGGLNLDPLETSPWVNIVNVPSGESPYNYVTPGKPELSYLFRKINCDSPDAGTRMPQGFAALSVDQQATIYDWIAAGAPVGTTDQIFRGTFDLRGFVP